MSIGLTWHYVALGSPYLNYCCDVAAPGAVPLASRDHAEARAGRVLAVVILVDVELELEQEVERAAAVAEAEPGIQARRGKCRRLFCSIKLNSSYIHRKVCLQEVYNWVSTNVTFLQVLIKCRKRQKREACHVSPLISALHCLTNVALLLVLKPLHENKLSVQLSSD